MPPTARCAVLLLAVWPSVHIPWGLLQLVRGPFTRPSAPGMQWRKVLGSGHEGGFGLRPGLNRLGLFCAFADDVSARAWLSTDSEPARWRSRARELLCLVLEPESSRGSWSGHGLAVTPREAVDAGEADHAVHTDRAGQAGAAQRARATPVASLTRASIRPTKAARFWSYSPAAEQSLAQAPGCLLAVGLGEAPLLRQATFSLWRDQASMDAYARTGAHQEAIRQAYANGFFSESMFVRFRVIEHHGGLEAFAAHGAHA